MTLMQLLVQDDKKAKQTNKTSKQNMILEWSDNLKAGLLITVGHSVRKWSLSKSAWSNVGNYGHWLANLLWAVGPYEEETAPLQQLRLRVLVCDPTLHVWPIFLYVRCQ